MGMHTRHMECELYVLLDPVQQLIRVCLLCMYACYVVCLICTPGSAAHAYIHKNACMHTYARTHTRIQTLETHTHPHTHPHTHTHAHLRMAPQTPVTHICTNSQMHSMQRSPQTLNQTIKNNLNPTPSRNSTPSPCVTRFGCRPRRIRYSNADHARREEGSEPNSPVVN